MSVSLAGYMSPVYLLCLKVYQGCQSHFLRVGIGLCSMGSGSSLKYTVLKEQAYPQSYCQFLLSFHT